MNFRQIEAFRTVMRSGTVSRAAELLGITQPAVSRSISELENGVGFALFERIKGRLVVTPEGQSFYRDVDASFIGLDRIRASAARIRDFGSGNIRIACLAALGSTLLPRAVKLFRDAYPNASLTLNIMSSSAIRNHIADGEYDLGIAADEIDLSGVEHQLFASVPGLCAIPPGHPLSHKKVIEPVDLAATDYIGLSPEDRARLRLHAICEEVNVTLKPVTETPNSATVCALALEGVGVGLINPMAAYGFPDRGLVLRPFVPEVLFKEYLLFRPDTQKTQLIRAFVAKLYEARNSRPTLQQV